MSSPPPAGDLAQRLAGGADTAVRGYVQTSLVFVALVAGLYLCFRLTVPFLMPLVTALVLAILLEPVHHRIKQWTGMPSVAAGATVVMAGIGVLVPVVFLLAEIANETAQGALTLRASIEDGFIVKTLSAYPRIAAAVSWVIDRIDLQGLAAEGASRLTNLSATFLSMSALQIVGALLAFYILFYFLRDRRQALVAVRGFLPFTSEEMALILRRIVDTVHATIFGTLITGVIQGVLGGAIFAAVGVPAALFLGVLVGVVAILPVLGTVMVWLPVAAVVGLNGDWMRAIIIAVAFLAIGIMDSFLYAALVGNRLHLHAGLTFLAVIGGLLLFGAAGFILGPLAFAATLVMKDILRERMKPSLASL